MFIDNHQSNVIGYKNTVKYVDSTESMHEYKISKVCGHIVSKIEWSWDLIKSDASVETYSCTYTEHGEFTIEWTFDIEYNCKPQQYRLPEGNPYTDSWIVAPYTCLLGFDTVADTFFSTLLQDK